MNPRAIPIVSADEQLASEDRPRRGRVEEGVALCLSGGGYRALLFHLGAIWSLNDHGWLPRIDRVSSVSGGSIAAGTLALAWSRLRFDERGRATNFVREVVAPLRRLASTTIDRAAVIGRLVSAKQAGNALVQAYRRELFGHATLADLPDRPHFVFNATNVQSGALFRISKQYLRDWRVGRVSRPRLGIAEAVAASSAFPPLLSPVIIRVDPLDFDDGTGDDLQRAPFTRRIVLTDGGVYDNLGLETAWKRFRTILVSDAGAKMPAEKRPKEDWLRHSLRVLEIVDDQSRSLRKRQLIGSFRSGLRRGAYWGIRSDIRHYRVADSLECPFAATLELAATPTRLGSLPATLQKRLINWGYAVCDAAMRRHVDRALAPPAEFPYPGSGVG